MDTAPTAALTAIRAVTASAAYRAALTEAAQARADLLNGIAARQAALTGWRRGRLYPGLAVLPGRDGDDVDF